MKKFNQYHNICHKTIDMFNLNIDFMIFIMMYHLMMLLLFHLHMKIYLYLIGIMIIFWNLSITLRQENHVNLFMVISNTLILIMEFLLILSIVVVHYLKNAI